MLFRIDILKFLKFHEFHWKTPVLEASFNKVAGRKAYNFIKRRLHHRCFHAKIMEFLRAPPVAVSVMKTLHIFQKSYQNHNVHRCSKS